MPRKREQEEELRLERAALAALALIGALVGILALVLALVLADS
jgi:hypothetical protein